MLPFFAAMVFIAQVPGTPEGLPYVLPSSQLEGRPAPAQTSPLQVRIDEAAAGATIEVEPGTYTGDLYVDRSVRLIGRGRPRLVGSGTGSVVRVRSADVTIEGFDIDGRTGGSLVRDSAGIHVAALRVAIRDCRIERSLFGIYLREADDAVLERNVITGLPEREPGDQGSGIHIFNTTGFTLIGNEVRYSRDGMYMQTASRGRIMANAVTDVRYGLHYMYSDDNVFEDNRFERSAAGAAVMYSKRIRFTRNAFLRNRGFASVGILLQGCDDVLAEDNRIEDNARGVFLEGTQRNTFRRNVFSTSDAAVVLYGSATGTRFEGNAFVGNLSPLQLIGRRTDAIFEGNYWSDADEPDLDGDGLRDRAYQLSNVFDHLRGNLTAADLFAQGLGATVLAGAERTFPVLESATVQDPHPLSRLPALTSVPSIAPPTRTRTAAGLAISAGALGSGLLMLFSGLVRRSRKAAA